MAATVLPLSAFAQAPPGGGYNIKTLGLTGPGYEYSDGAGLHRSFAGLASSDGRIISPDGKAAGASGRFNTAGTLLGQDAWFFNGTSSQRIGLTGAPYEYVDPQGIWRNHFALWMNASNWVGGDSSRFDVGSNNTSSGGWDVYLFNGTTSQAVNPTGTGYQYVLPSGAIYRESHLGRVDDAGRVFGYAYRFATDGTPVGSDVWRYNGTSASVISLTGAGYEYSTPGGIARTALGAGPTESDAAGRAYGFNIRYAASGDYAGTDAWFFNGSTTSRVNLIGGAYEYGSGVPYRSGLADAMSSGGLVVGHSDRFTSAGDALGRDIWRSNGTTTAQINLTGAGYQYTVSGQTTRFASSVGISAAGRVAGNSDRYSAAGDGLGSDAWAYNGTTTQRINLTGGVYEFTDAFGLNRYGNAVSINLTGDIIGHSGRAASNGNDLGQDVWLYNGTSTQRINLAGGSYEYTSPDGPYRQGTGLIINDSNVVVGSSNRFGADGSDLGLDVWWFKDGDAAAKRMGLAGPGYERSDPTGNYRLSDSYITPTANQAVGVTRRFNAAGDDVGQAGWLYDAVSNTSFAMEFSVSASGYSSTTPVFISDQGVVLGFYELYSGNALLGNHVFWWSATGGFRDLGQLVGGGLNANGWSGLDEFWDATGTFAGGSPLYIVGRGNVTGQPDPESSYLLTAQIPEPACLGLLLVPLATLHRRRLRRA